MIRSWIKILKITKRIYIYVCVCVWDVMFIYINLKTNNKSALICRMEYWFTSVIDVVKTNQHIYVEQIIDLYQSKTDMFVVLSAKLYSPLQCPMIYYYVYSCHQLLETKILTYQGCLFWRRCRMFNFFHLDKTYKYMYHNINDTVILFLYFWHVILSTGVGSWICSC